MDSAWRLVAVVDFAAGNRLLQSICDTEPGIFRCEWVAIDDRAYDRWEIFVNFMRGDAEGMNATRAVLRTIKVLGQSQGLRYRIVRDALSAVDAANPSDTRRFA